MESAATCNRKSLLVPWQRARVTVALLTLIAALAACGGGSNSPPPPAAVGTLAYVLTECRDTPAGFFERQELHVRQGSRDVVVFQPPGVGPVSGIGGLCRVLTTQRDGGRSVARDAIQAVLVSPDGLTVVFQASNDFSVVPPLPLQLPPDQQGIFAVRTDGTGLRRLGPPSREPFFFVIGTSRAVPVGGIQFSPDGRRLAVVDRGPDDTGTDASQIWLIEVATGMHTQITHLPPPTASTDLPSNSPTIVGFSFLDNETIGFLSFGNAGGPGLHNSRLFAVGTGGSHQLRPIDSPVRAPGGSLVPIFGITGTRPQAAPIELEGDPINGPCGSGCTIGEMFLFDGVNVLQLTNFRRYDTGQIGTTLVDVDDQHVYFAASATTPFVTTNPSESCQLFSIDRTGADLRQLTTFSELGEGQRPRFGCEFNPGPGCAVAPVAQDARTRRLIVYSNCDLLGTHFVGAQLFAINPDGTGVEQLTNARGLVTEPDGTVLGELPGPQAYGPHL